MPLLTGAITALALAGVPGQPYGTLTKAPNPASARTYSVDFTRLSLGALPGRVYGSFAGRVEPSEVFRYVSDTIKVVVTESPVSDVQISTSDVLAPRVADSGVPWVARPVWDFITPRLGEAVPFIEKAGVLARPVSDTITPILTESSAIRVLIAVEDTVTAVVTDASDITETDVLAVSDTVTVVLSETSTLRKTAIGQRVLPVSDTIRPQITELLDLREGGDVDVIRIVANPYLIIRIVPR